MKKLFRLLAFIRAHLPVIWTIIADSGGKSKSVLDFHIFQLLRKPLVKLGNCEYLPKLAIFWSDIHNTSNFPSPYSGGTFIQIKDIRKFSHLFGFIYSDQKYFSFLVENGWNFFALRTIFGFTPLFLIFSIFQISKFSPVFWRGGRTFIQIKDIRKFSPFSGGGTFIQYRHFQTILHLLYVFENHFWNLWKRVEFEVQIVIHFQLNWDLRVSVYMRSDRLENDRMDLYFRLLFYFRGNSGRSADFFSEYWINFTK